MVPAVLSAITSHYGQVISILRQIEAVDAGDQSKKEDNARQDHLLENGAASSV